jgi:RNase adaptor protein for sRNA GlmZ degradation
MGNYHPILIKIDTQTNKKMLSSKATKAEMIDRFQDDRRRHF